MHPPDPIVRFQALLAEARAVDRARLPEPTAFALGTVNADGQPSVRMLLSRRNRVIGSSVSGCCLHR